jgi:hypothetical protein
MFGRSPTVFTALLAGTGLIAACGPPPVNGQRVWDQQATRAASDGATQGGAGDPDAAEPGSGGAGGDPVAAGGSGGSSLGSGGSSFQGGRGGTTDAGAGGGSGGVLAVDASTRVPPEARPLANGPALGAGCKLQVTFTTVTEWFDYAPKNVGAVWIADGPGGFLKTLQVWAARRISKLGTWSAATADAGASRNTTDAITGATARTHGVHMSSWDCTDWKGARLRQGAYSVCMEMNESNDPGSSSFLCVPITLAAQAWRITPPRAPCFEAVTVEYSP